MTSTHPIVSSVQDLSPQLANARAYWLGWGSSDDVDAALPIYRTGLPNGMLNGVLRARGIDVGTAVRTAREALDGTRWLWWNHSGDSDPDVADQLVRHGAAEVGQVPIMAAHLGDVPTVPVPGGLRIAEARTTADLAAMATVYPVPNGMTEADTDAVTAVELARSDRYDDQLRYVAWMDDQPVACGALSISHGVAGIYNMATRAEYEGRGIATAVAVELLQQATARGLQVATLTASPRGALVYRRLGFETVSSYRLFAV